MQGSRLAFNVENMVAMVQYEGVGCYTFQDKREVWESRFFVC